MNQRISRWVALCIVTMLILGLGVQWVGTASSITAQEADCGPWIPYAEAEGTPRAEPGEQDAYQIISEFEAIDDLSPDLMVDVLLTQVVLFDGETLSVLSDQSSIVRVDSGFVQITICDGSQVEIQQAGADRPTRFGAGTFDIPAGGAIIVDAEDQYYLTSVSGGVDASGTPIAATPVADDERTGSTLTIVTWHGIRLAQGICGGTSC